MFVEEAQFTLCVPHNVTVQPVEYNTPERVPELPLSKDDIEESDASFWVLQDLHRRKDPGKF